MKLMIIKNYDSKNNDNNNKYGTVIKSWISLAQWMPRTELRLSLIALWVNICLENAVKPIDTFILQNIQRRDLIAIFGGHLS